MLGKATHRVAVTLLLLGGFAAALNAQVRPRITRRVDNTTLVRLGNTTHPAVALSRDLGRVAPDLALGRMLLQLQSSPEQEAALQQLLAEQQDPSSPRYHDWLTPEQFGEQFGVAQQDLDTITAWLQSQGFLVTEIAAGRRSIEFSGTARQVEDAFHTEMHRYERNGVRHLANASDISIPEALASVVGGVVSLHDFRARPLHHVAQQGVNLSPYTNFTSGARGISPYDFAAIYNVSALWNAGYDGTGQSIAVVGETNIKVSDVAAFRSMFGLPANNPQIIVNGKDPGITSSGDETEADLDVEWAGAVAKGAAIKFVVSASTASSDGVTLSAQYIVNNNVAPVMTLSFGLCEAQMGSGNQFFNNLWQQAATQGISVFAASGDSGSAGCDVPYSTSSSGQNATKPASQGFGVNGLASTPFNVAVGGTQFNDAAAPATYWNSSNDSHYASAKGYIPEVAWNESSYTAGSSSNSLYAGGGGASTMWPRPTWQTGTGVPTGSTRVLPDVSLTAAGHDGYVIEQEGSLYLVGGTSASTPSFAGIMAMVNQYTAARNGNPNSKLYTIAAHAPTVYHDTTSGANAVPCAGGSPNCSAAAPATNVGQMKGYSAAAGFDLATGWGSVDAYALTINFGPAPTGPTITSLSPNPMTGSASNQTLTINGAGFAAGSSLKVKVGATTYSGSQVTFVSASALTVAVNVGATAQTLAVQVTNPNGQSSNSVNLQVTAPAVPPVINSLAPNPMTGSNSAQILTINGSGFQSGLKLQIGTTTILSTQLTVFTATQIQVNIIVGLATHTYPVQVINPNGQASNTVNFQVNAPPAPAIASLNPNPLTGSKSAQTLTITGSNFQSGSGLMVVVGTSVYQGSQVTVVSASQIKVTVTLAAGSRTLGVQVINPSGIASNVAWLTVH
ncbi:MAG TPA: protease pro-enzyme activation domain-containing protein [Bryobacteraceae bacterium]|nr:protease pro-enzyme activation domain-containing protein [Bryobacteraceae bacterium]